MARPDPRPSTSVERFFEAYVVGNQKAPLIVTLKSEMGASVNIDGPFEFHTFRWSEWRTEAGEPDEVVLAPAFANKRERGESSVHLHIPWSKVTWVRLQYLSARDLPLIDERIRIALYTDRPPAKERGKETLWFNTNHEQPLTRVLPEIDHSGISETAWIDELIRRLPVTGV
jgi:hypothetical protein